MPLAGGPADKAGNRYEMRWAVHCVAQILLGQARTIQLELPGVDEVEFALTRANLREGHQVKRQISGQAGWSIAALRSHDGQADAQGLLTQGTGRRYSPQRTARSCLP